MCPMKFRGRMYMSMCLCGDDIKLHLAVGWTSAVRVKPRGPAPLLPAPTLCQVSCVKAEGTLSLQASPPAAHGSSAHGCGIDEHTQRV